MANDNTGMAWAQHAPPTPFVCLQVTFLCGTTCFGASGVAMLSCTRSLRCAVAFLASLEESVMSNFLPVADVRKDCHDSCLS